LHVSNVHAAIEINREIKSQVQKLKKLLYSNVPLYTVQNPYAVITVIKLNKPRVLSNHV